LKPLAKLHLLLPAWALFLMICSSTLALFEITSWQFFAGSFITGVCLTWRWLTDQQQILTKLNPSLCTSYLNVPGECQKSIGNLLTSLERYATVTENLAGAVLIRDLTGKITYCNPYTEALFGLSRYQVMNSDTDEIEAITYPGDRENYRKAQMLSLIGEPFQYRQKFRHNSGIEMWAETRVMPLLDQNGDVTSSLSIMVDITHQVRVEQQAAEINQDLSDFNFMISHDLRTPLVTIKGGVRMISSVIREHGTSAHQEMFNHIEHANTRLDTLINGVVEYGRVSKIGFELIPLDPRTVLLDVLKVYKGKIDESNATVAIPDSMDFIQAAPLPLSQIFSNLVENSIKYCDPNRTPFITVTCSSSAGASSHCTITFTDNCIGIPTEKIHNIFRPFQRVHPNHTSGSGIGLACVKKLVEKLHGTIEVKSDVGVGSTFLLHFEKSLSAN
jgi:PAS domain S-box-containing protein